MDLIDSILRGDKTAMEKLYHQYERYWFRTCLRYSRNRSEAQDIMQEGVIMVFRDLQQFDPSRGAFKSWSNRIMINAALRFLKKHQWQLSFEDLMAINKVHSFDQRTVENLSAKEIIKVIQQLPSGYRLVFNMYEIEGYSHRER